MCDTCLKKYFVNSSSFVGLFRVPFFYYVR